MCPLNCFMLHIWQDNTLLLCSLELLQRLAYFRRSDEGCPLTKWLSYYVCMKSQQDKLTKTPRDSLSCWNTPSLTLGSDSRRATCLQLTLTNAAWVSTSAQWTGECVCRSQCLCKKGEMQWWHLITWKTSGKSWCCSKPEPKLFFFNRDNFKIFQQHLSPNSSLLDSFSLK